MRQVEEDEEQAQPGSWDSHGWTGGKHEGGGSYIVRGRRTKSTRECGSSTNYLNIIWDENKTYNAQGCRDGHWATTFKSHMTSDNFLPM